MKKKIEKLSDLVFRNSRYYQTMNIIKLKGIYMNSLIKNIKKL